MNQKGKYQDYELSQKMIECVLNTKERNKQIENRLLDTIDVGEKRNTFYSVLGGSFLLTVLAMIAKCLGYPYGDILVVNLMAYTTAIVTGVSYRQNEVDFERNYENMDSQFTEEQIEKIDDMKTLSSCSKTPPLFIEELKKYREILIQTKIQ